MVPGLGNLACRVFSHWSHARARQVVNCDEQVLSAISKKNLDLLSTTHGPMQALTGRDNFPYISCQAKLE